jgi:hypothetical protein
MHVARRPGAKYGLWPRNEISASLRPLRQLRVDWSIGWMALRRIDSAQVATEVVCGQWVAETGGADILDFQSGRMRGTRAFQEYLRQDQGDLPDRSGCRCSA